MNAYQISAAKEIQRYWFKHWANNPGPEFAVDLDDVVRPQLIKLGNEISGQLNSPTDAKIESLIATLKIEGLSNDSKRQIYSALNNLRVYDNRLQQVLISGLLRVGTTGDYAPFSFQQQPDNSLAGIDIDLARDLAQTLRVEIQFVQTSWPSLLDDLANGVFDIAMSGISRSLDRQKVGYFSNPYHRGGKSPISRCDNKDQFDSLAKIDVASTRLIVNPGGTNEQFVNTRIHNALKILHQDNRSIFYEIINKKADVMITDSIEVRLQTSRHAELCATMPNRTLTFQEKGYLMPQEVELKEYVDLWLTSRVGDGSIKQIFDKYVD